MGNCLGLSRRKRRKSGSDSSSDFYFHSKRADYLKEELLGEGSFGSVYSCTRLPDFKKVAVKMTSEEDGAKEEKILQKLNGLDVDAEKSSLCLLLDSFLHRSFYCMVYERLDMDIAEYISANNLKPFSISQIRPVAQQMLVALRALKSLGLIHCDIKPDNIMLVDCLDQPLKVKLIDFGLAQNIAEMEEQQDLQVLGYRAPEISLGLKGDEGIDMWALGCVLARMFIAVNNLFPVHCEYEYLRAVVQMMGQPSDELLESSPRGGEFFTCRENPPIWKRLTGDKCSGSKFRLFTPKEYRDYNGVATPKQRPSVYTKCSSLQHISAFQPKPQNQLEQEDLTQFLSLLEEMLRVDKSIRITPEQGVRHSFVTMAHLAERKGDPYVTAALRHMRVCHSATGQELFADTSPSVEASGAVAAPQRSVRRAWSEKQHTHTEGGRRPRVDLSPVKKKTT